VGRPQTTGDSKAFGRAFASERSERSKRSSVDIEHIDDMKADLQAAFDQAL